MCALKLHKMRVALIDNDKLVLRLLPHLILSKVPNASIIWTASSGARALELFEATVKPNIVMVDMSMEDMSGVEICRRIRCQSESVWLLAMTAFSLDKYAGAASNAGAQGIVDKSNMLAIQQALTAINHGFLPLSLSSAKFRNPQVAYAEMAVVSSSDNVVVLTARERQILDICVQGYTVKEAAVIMQVSESTAKTHMRHAVFKLGARNKAHAIAIWGERR